MSEPLVIDSLPQILANLHNAYVEMRLAREQYRLKKANLNGALPVNLKNDRERTAYVDERTAGERMAVIQAEIAHYKANLEYEYVVLAAKSEALMVKREAENETDDELGW